MTNIDVAYVADVARIKSPKAGTKRALVMSAMASKTGCTAAELVKLTGWAASAVSGFMGEDVMRSCGFGYGTSRRKDGSLAYHLVLPAGVSKFEPRAKGGVAKSKPASKSNGKATSKAKGKRKAK